MSSRSSSSFNSEHVHDNLRCICGRTTITHTSWTDQNSGRRFLCCPERSCNSCFRFTDPPMCDRSKKIIPSLLKKMNKLRDEKRRWKMATLFLLVSFAVALFMFVWAGGVADGMRKKKDALKMLGV